MKNLRKFSVPLVPKQKKEKNKQTNKEETQLAKHKKREHNIKAIIKDSPGHCN